jgi:hypothetical protein
MPYYLILVPLDLVIDQLNRDQVLGTLGASEQIHVTASPKSKRKSATGNTDVGRCQPKRRRSEPKEMDHDFACGDVVIVDDGSVANGLEDEDHLRDFSVPIAPTEEMEYLVRVYEMKKRHWKNLTCVKRLFERKAQQLPAVTTSPCAPGDESKDPARVKVGCFLANVARIMEFLDGTHGKDEKSSKDLGALDRVENHIETIVMPVVTEINKARNRKKRHARQVEST